jgi:hypothetical protein
MAFVNKHPDGSSSKWFLFVRKDFRILASTSHEVWVFSGTKLAIKSNFQRFI